MKWVCEISFGLLMYFSVFLKVLWMLMVDRLVVMLCVCVLWFLCVVCRFLMSFGVRWLKFRLMMCMMWLVKLIEILVLVM